MPEADTEYRRFADELANVLDLGLERFGIARAVGEEDTVGLERQHVLGGSQRRHYRHAASNLHQPAKDIVLDSEIVSNHVMPGFRRPWNELGGRARVDGFTPF